MSTPLVSLALVSYNQEKFLKDALASVLQQDYKALEIIVLDDASNDHSQEVISEIISSNNITIWNLKLRKKNLGFCKNLNEILSIANGKYLFVLAGDDMMQPDRISSLVEKAESLSEEFAVVYSDCNIIDENNLEIYPSFIEHYNPRKKHLPEGQVLADLADWNFIPNTAVLMRINALKQIGGFDESMMLEDWSTWLSLAEAGFLFAAIRGKNFSYRLLSTSTLRKMGGRFYEDIFSMMKKLVHHKEPEIRKHLKKNIGFCCKHAFYKESVRFSEMFKFYNKHFGFNFKLTWLYFLFKAGVKGSGYKKQRS